MAEPTKADLEAKLAERDAELADLKAQLEQQPTPAPPAAVPAVPEGGPITADLPASRPPAGVEAFNPERPEVGQYVGHGAEAIASEAGTFDVDPTTGLIVGRRKA